MEYMNAAEVPLNKLLSGIISGAISSVEKTVNTRAGKVKLAAFLIKNKRQIATAFSSARSIDLQVNMIRILQKTLTRRQIQDHNPLSGCSGLIALDKRVSREQMRECLLEYNNATAGGIIGCRLRSLSSSLKDVRLTGGILFLNDDSIRIYGEGHAIVIFYRSILGVSSMGSGQLTINAHESKKVELEFVEDGACPRVRERITAMFSNQLETEDSVAVSADECRSKCLLPDGEGHGGITEGILTANIINRALPISSLMDNGTDSAAPPRAGVTGLSPEIAENAAVSGRLRNDANSGTECVTNSTRDCTPPNAWNSTPTNSPCSRKKIALELERSKMPSIGEDLRVDNLSEEAVASSGGSASASSISSAGSYNESSKDHSWRGGRNKIQGVRRRSGKLLKKEYSTDYLPGLQKRRKYFKSVKCFGKQLVEKVDSIYKKQKKYNKQVYKELNNRARMFRKAMLSLCNVNIHVLSNKL